MMTLGMSFMMEIDLGGDGIILELPGDPTVVGWITTAGYFLAAFLCWRTSRAEINSGSAFDRRRRKWFWLALAALVALLGVNKQLDLQSLMTMVGRRIADFQGWYEYRRGVQKAFMVLLAVAGIACAVIAIRLMRPVWREYVAAMCGGGMLITYVIMRAAWFEKVDDGVGVVEQMQQAAALLELGGIACVALAAWRRRLRLRRRPDSA